MIYKPHECRYCGSSKTRWKIVASLLECGRCGSFTCTEPPPKYTPEYHAYKRPSPMRPKYWLMRIKSKRCTPKSPGHLTIADLGCGAGHALWWAHRRGHRTVGWDVKTSPAPGNWVDVFDYDLNALTGRMGGKCDVVWCWHTLEHAENPAELVWACKRLLKPGGTAYVECPVAERIVDLPGDLWVNGCFPEHRGIPSEKWMRMAFPEKHTEYDYPSEGRWLYLQFGMKFHFRAAYKKTTNH